MIQHYVQTTCQSCLSCCLLQKAKGEIIEQEEWNCMAEGLKHNKFDFPEGHITYVLRTYDCKIQRYLDNELYFDFIQSLSPEEELNQKRITVDLIDECLNLQPLLCIDMFHLFGLKHAPHWVIILEKQNNNYLIYDPADGAIKPITEEALDLAINSLRINLKTCPEIIVVNASYE